MEIKKNVMKKILFFIVVGTVLGCSISKEEKLQNLNGYWEIEKVVTETGAEKTFAISTVVDFIEIDGNQGKRTKVNPQLDGSFKNNGSTETFEVDTSGNNLILHYKTPFATWDETIEKATTTNLKTLNSEGKQYFYKRFEKFDFK
ncbi:MAG: hypothetical protein ACJA1Z_000764 [Patiriisocius sp.]